MYDIEEILPDVLISNVYAVMNFEHVEKLTELCTSAGIVVPTLLKINVDKSCTFWG